MSRLAPFYLVIAALWAIIATIDAVNANWIAAGLAATAAALALATAYCLRRSTR